jgi:AraC-like DNA-binding protein
MANFQLNIDKWFTKFQKYFFIYKDGFFELPFLANSPEAVVQSIKKMPFIKHDMDRQLVKSKTPLVSGVFYYEKIEEGLWIIQGEFEYKVNVNFKRVSDDSLPSDYYFLCLKVYSVKQKNALINGISYSNYSWLLFKPDTWSTNCQFKGAKELTYTIFFNENWLKNVLYNQKHFIGSTIHKFFESDAPHLIWLDNSENMGKLQLGIYNNFRSSGIRSDTDKEALKDKVYEMFIRFVDKYETDGFNSAILEIPDNERKAIYKAEKLLLQYLCTSFPGIEQLGKEVGMSATKLKVSFKLVYCKTIFQYFQEKQMLLAKKILLENNLKIKDLANSFGYENSSKFSNAFLKQTGTLPSELPKG